jgi:mucin-19
MKKKLLIGLGIVIIIVVTVVAIRIPRYDPEIRTWHDLHAVRYHLGKSFVLMNDLDSTTAGYAELAGPTAHDGKGWRPIGGLRNPFRGTLDGQGHTITGPYVDRPLEAHVGLLGFVADEAEVRNIRVEAADIRGMDVVGVLAGTNHGMVLNCGSAANVSGVTYVGGLIGANRGTVSKSYSGGNVTGDMEITGGLVARNSGIISDSYSTAHVSGIGIVGGLVGHNTDGTISNAYATGSVSVAEGRVSAGGLIGHHMGIVSSSFWDTETSGMEESVGGTGKATAEMKAKATFIDAGWDFDDIWNINDVNDGYPFLRWQLENR